jgi:hypothetical protein
MKTHLAIMIIVIVGAVCFVIGYSVAPTDVETVRHGVAQKAKAAAGGGGDSGGYGGGGDSGGYGAPASGGYGAPASGGYGAPSGGYGM